MHDDRFLLARPAIALLLAAACSTPGAPRGAPASGPEHASPEPSGPLTAAPPPASPVPAPPTDRSVDGQPCPEAADPRVPRGSGCLAGIGADLDGDGVRDAFLLFAALGGGGRPLAWRAKAVTASAGAVQESAVETPSAEAIYPWLAMAADADGDGRDEVFVGVDHGASTEFLELFAVVGTGIVRVEESGGGAMRIALGGSATHGNGVECRDADGDGRPELLLLGAVTSDARRYDWQEQVYRWNGKTVARAETRRGTFEATDASHPRVQRYWQLSCAGTR